MEMLGAVIKTEDEAKKREIRNNIVRHVEEKRAGFAETFSRKEEPMLEALKDEEGIKKEVAAIEANEPKYSQEGQLLVEGPKKESRFKIDLSRIKSWAETQNTTKGLETVPMVPVEEKSDESAQYEALLRKIEEGEQNMRRLQEELMRLKTGAEQGMRREKAAAGQGKHEEQKASGEAASADEIIDAEYVELSKEPKTEGGLVDMERMSRALEVTKSKQLQSLESRTPPEQKDFMQRQLDRWNKLDWKWKVGMGVGLAAVSLAAAATGPTAYGLAWGASRLFSSFGAAASMDTLMQRFGPEGLKDNHAARRTLAIVGGTLFGFGASWLVSEMFGGHAHASPEASHGTTVAPTPETAGHTYSVHSGDNSYKVLGHLHGVENLTDAQRANAFENFIHSKEFLATGIDLDHLKPGQSIDMGKLQAAFDGARVHGEGLAAHAQHLHGGAHAHAPGHATPDTGQPHAMGDQGNPLPEHKPASVTHGPGSPTYTSVPGEHAPIALHPESVADLSGKIFSGSGLSESDIRSMTHGNFGEALQRLPDHTEAGTLDRAHEKLLNYVSKLVGDTNPFASNTPPAMPVGDAAALELQKIVGYQPPQGVFGVRQYGIGLGNKSIEQVLQEIAGWKSRHGIA